MQSVTHTKSLKAQGVARPLAQTGGYAGGGYPPVLECEYRKKLGRRSS